MLRVCPIGLTRGDSRPSAVVVRRHDALSRAAAAVKNYRLSQTPPLHAHSSDNRPKQNRARSKCTYRMFLLVGGRIQARACSRSPAFGLQTISHGVDLSSRHRWCSLLWRRRYNMSCLKNYSLCRFHRLASVRTEVCIAPFLPSSLFMDERLYQLWEEYVN